MFSRNSNRKGAYELWASFIAALVGLASILLCVRIEETYSTVLAVFFLAVSIVSASELLRRTARDPYSNSIPSTSATKFLAAVSVLSSFGTVFFVVSTELLLKAVL